MKLQELILEYEKELQDTLDVFEVKNINDITYGRHRWRAYAIRDFIEKLKNLNGETVKRKELIDFAEFLYNRNINDDSMNAEDWVNVYLNQLMSEA